MPDFNLENKITGRVCGLDEVGRGPLAGPVFAACVFISDQMQAFLRDVNDSKKLTLKKREDLYVHITQNCSYGIGQCSVEEIDEINILQASLLAMSRAYDAMNVVCSHALVDGNKLPHLPCPSTAVIKGDTHSISIAAASIVAKVERDRLMKNLDLSYPEYGWASNSGYGSKYHREALIQKGITPHHRKTFSPIRQILENRIPQTLSSSSKKASVESS